MENYFNFEGTPFTRDIACADLFDHRGFAELLARLRFLADRGSFGVVTGESGTGKSTALRALAEKLDPSVYRFIYLADSGLAPRAFYRELLHQFGVRPRFSKTETRRQFQATVLELAGNGLRPVVVLDEAHLLPHAMLQEMRFFLNFNLDSASPLTLLLAGQTELRDTLRLRAFEAIAQRVNVFYHLPGMDEGETKKYIYHQLQTVKAKSMLFSDSAIRLIFKHSRGRPRVVNNLATGCLMDIWGLEQHVVDEESVLRVLKEYGFI